MDQVKIGKLIASCRKQKKITQKELAEKLGVTDKAVSKWENGGCLPDVSLYKELCEILGITLNEFFAGEKIAEEDYKKVADENLLNALENSAFTLKERISYFGKKWEKDHFFELTLEMIIIVIFIIYGFIKDNGIQYLFMIIGFISGVIEYNRKMAYIESRAYGKSSTQTMEELKKSMKSFRECKKIIETFETKKEAVEYMMQETGLSKKECSEAYDIIHESDFDK